MPIFERYFEELILLGGIILLRLFGYHDKAGKLEMKRNKRIKRLKKRLSRETIQAEKDLQELKNLEEKE